MTMNLNFASVDLDELTRPRSAGRPINVHEVRQRRTREPDYEKMRELIHQPAKLSAEPDIAAA